MLFYTVSIFSSWIILTIWTSQCSRLELIIGEKGGKGGRKRGGKKGERKVGQTRQNHQKNFGVTVHVALGQGEWCYKHSKVVL